MARTRGGRWPGGVGLLSMLAALSAGCQVHVSVLEEGPPVTSIGAAYRSTSVAVNPQTATEPAQTWWQRRGNDVVQASSLSTEKPAADALADRLPTEKDKSVHPAYMIEPPDVLLLEPVHLVPRPGYRLEPSDVLAIQVAEGSSSRPISGRFHVRSDGTVHLGPTCGTVRVGGSTLAQAAETIRVHLSHVLREPQVAVGLAHFHGMEQLTGQRRVGSDGTIALGSYGNVSVTGLSVQQARQAIERHLAKQLLNPEVSVSVAATNSKVFYLILDGGMFGQQVLRMPLSGNETVLDAVSRVHGRWPMSASSTIWLARPVPARRSYQILPVRWQQTVAAGETTTNYQLFPGDRLYVKTSFPAAFHNYLEQTWASVEEFFNGPELPTEAPAGSVSVADRR